MVCVSEGDFTIIVGLKELQSGNKFYIKSVQGNIEGRTAYLVFRKTIEHYNFNNEIDDEAAHDHYPSSIKTFSKVWVDFHKCNECNSARKLENVRKILIDYYIPENENHKLWISMLCGIVNSCRYLFQNFNCEKSKFNIHIGNLHYNCDAWLNPNYNEETSCLEYLGETEDQLRSING